MKKQGLPAKWEVVICRIVKIHPNSAFAELLEYDKTGMIHVSEVASKWVKDIRQFLKERQIVACRVMAVDPNHIELSIKRVRKEEITSKLNEYKRERKSEKMLELAARSMKKSFEQAYNEIGNQLIEEFGSISRAFEFALKNPDLLKSKNIPRAWIDALAETAKKQYEEKTYIVRADLNLISYQPDGINYIKNVLSKAKAKGVEIKYTSAPKYMMTANGKKYKEVEAKVVSVCQEIVKEISNNNGEASFELLKK